MDPTEAPALNIIWGDDEGAKNPQGYLQDIHAANEIGRTLDGVYVWALDGTGVLLSAANLRTIADELDRLGN